MKDRTPTISTTEALKNLRPWQRTFCRVIREGGDVTAACKAVKVSRFSAHAARGYSHAFAAAWDAAAASCKDDVEKAIISRV